MCGECMRYDSSMTQPPFMTWPVGFGSEKLVENCFMLRPRVALIGNWSSSMSTDTWPSMTNTYLQVKLLSIIEGTTLMQQGGSLYTLPACASVPTTGPGPTGADNQHHPTMSTIHPALHTTRTNIYRSPVRLCASTLRGEFLSCSVFMEQAWRDQRELPPLTWFSFRNIATLKCPSKWL